MHGEKAPSLLPTPAQLKDLLRAASSFALCRGFIWISHVFCRGAQILSCFRPPGCPENPSKFTDHQTIKQLIFLQGVCVRVLRRKQRPAAGIGSGQRGSVATGGPVAGDTAAWESEAQAAPTTEFVAVPRAIPGLLGERWAAAVQGCSRGSDLSTAVGPSGAGLGLAGCGAERARRSTAWLPATDHCRPSSAVRPSD